MMNEMQSEEFERFYAAHAESLLAFLVHRTGDLELARDVHADTFERVLSTRRRYDSSRGSERTWLYTIAVNRLRDLQRRGQAEGRALDRHGAAPATGSGPEFDAIGERDALRRALATLSDAEREAVALRYAADLPLEEIAAICGTRTTAIKGRLHRALRKLHEALE
jgi:RNA polymerase sigma-70 factor (ECF subfamily)